MSCMADAVCRHTHSIGDQRPLLRTGCLPCRQLTFLMQSVSVKVVFSLYSADSKNFLSPSCVPDRPRNVLAERTWKQDV